MPIKVIENDNFFIFFQVDQIQGIFLLLSQPNIKVHKQVKKKKKEQVHRDKCYVVLKLMCPSL